MAGDLFTLRIAELERRLASIERSIDDYSAVRSRGLRNESDISGLRQSSSDDLKSVRNEIAALRQAINVAAIGLATSALIFAATIWAVFK